MKALTCVTVFIAVALVVLASATATGPSTPVTDMTFESTTEYVTETVSFEIGTSSEAVTFEESSETTETSTVPDTTEAEKTTEPKTTKEYTVTTTSANGEVFHITVYVPDDKWGYSTAMGITSSHLQTCAVDPSVIPLGKIVEVNGLSLLACDTGNRVKGKVIDIFYDGTEEEAQQWINSFGDYHTVIY